MITANHPPIVCVRVCTYIVCMLVGKNQLQASSANVFGLLQRNVILGKLSSSNHLILGKYVVSIYK